MQSLKEKYITRFNALVAKNKPCKRFYDLIEEAHRQIGKIWPENYWNALFKNTALTVWRSYAYAEKKQVNLQ